MLSNSLDYFRYLHKILGKLLKNSFGPTLEQNYLYDGLDIYEWSQNADMLKIGQGGEVNLLVAETVAMRNEWNSKEERGCSITLHILSMSLWMPHVLSRCWTDGFYGDAPVIKGVVKEGTWNCDWILLHASASPSGSQHS